MDCILNGMGLAGQKRNDSGSLLQIRTLVVLALTLLQMALYATVAMGQVATQGKPLDAEILMQEFQLSDEMISNLLAGEIVLGSAPDVTDDDLVAVLLAWYPASVADTVDAIERVINSTGEGRLLASYELTAADAFPDVGFDENEVDEVKALLRFTGGDQFQLSTAEIEAFQQLGKQYGKDASTAQAAVSSAYRDMLEGRYRSYLADGLAGMDTYKGKGRTVIDPAAGLQAIVDDIRELEEYYPVFYRNMSDYPDAPDGVWHDFFLEKKLVQDRPNFILIHRMVEVAEAYALIMVREFYVGHSYESMQVSAVILPYNRHRRRTRAMSRRFDSAFSRYNSALSEQTRID